MIETLRNAWKIRELRNKILFTIAILAIYRFGAQVFTPFVNSAEFSRMFEEELAGTVMGFMNMLGGGAFSQASIFSLSIQPYINASIIMNLLTVGIPALERLQKEGGEEGKKKIAAITRYATVFLGLLLGFGQYVMMLNFNRGGYEILTNESKFAAVVIVLTLAAGASFIMWLGEQITEFGVGNGISIILFASIVSRGPDMVGGIIDYITGGDFVELAVVLAVVILAVSFVVYITQAERRIPIQYSKRMVGRKMYGGQSTYLPLKVNMSGVMPIIFASAITSFPATVAQFVSRGQDTVIDRWFGMTSIPYAIAYLLLIVAFSYFYQSIQFNPIEIANNLKNNGGFVPGFRPGRPTSDFIRKVLNRITLFGALFLGIIAVMPIVMSGALTRPGLAMGGTSLLIVVGVALETVKAIESQMMMRHYKGFLE
jgi:preprotein translocase subunit SecY